jgi:hypothetical protein
MKKEEKKDQEKLKIDNNSGSKTKPFLSTRFYQPRVDNRWTMIHPYSSFLFLTTSLLYLAWSK